MEQLVQIAFGTPYPLVALAIIVLFGVMAIFEAPTDVFPVRQIPVRSIVWIYDNLVPAPGSSFSEDQGLGSSLPAWIECGVEVALLYLHPNLRGRARTAV